MKNLVLIFVSAIALMACSSGASKIGDPEGGFDANGDAGVGRDAPGDSGDGGGNDGAGRS